MIDQKALQRLKDSKDQSSISIELGGLHLANEDLTEIFRDSISLKQNLKHLYLQDNKLEQISVSQFKNLETLSLKNNPLDQIPTEILELKKLKYLFIDENQLKNSLEIILKLKNLKEVNIWSGNKYFTISLQILSILGQPSQLKKIKWEILKLENIIRRKNEAKKYIDTLARILFKLSVITILFCVVWLITYNSTFFTQNWGELEPYTVIISLISIALFAMLARTLGKTIEKWIDDTVLEIFERFMYFIVGFDYKEYKLLKSTLEHLHSELNEIKTILPLN